MGSPCSDEVDREHEEETRDEPRGTPTVESPERNRAARSSLLKQKRGNQEAAEDEEEVDANGPLVWQSERVQRDDWRDRKCADAVKRRPVAEPHAQDPNVRTVASERTRAEARPSFNPSESRELLGAGAAAADEEERAQQDCRNDDQDDVDHEAPFPHQIECPLRSIAVPRVLSFSAGLASTHPKR